jgi:hypothetical protein
VGFLGLCNNCGFDSINFVWLLVKDLRFLVVDAAAAIKLVVGFY